MFGLFKRKPLLETEVVNWQLGCFAWLLRHTGGYAAFRTSVLVQPNARFFPETGLRGEALAQAIFDRVKQYAGMENWPCRLEQQEADPNPHVGLAMLVQGLPTSAAGTFRADEKGAVITWNPSGLNNPEALVATFAHELAHYLTATFPEEPPGGAENWEFATDMASVFMGFGLFATNSAFNFRQYANEREQGWRAQRLGYMSETENLQALAIFCCLLDIPEGEVLPYLKPALRGVYKRARKDLADWSDAIALLQAVEGQQAVQEQATETPEPRSPYEALSAPYGYYNYR